MPLETRRLNRAIHDLCLELFNGGETSPTQFKSEFHKRHQDLVDEFAEYGFDQFLREQGRKALGKIDREIAKADPDQTEMFDGAEVPSLLPIVRSTDDGVTRIWVPRRKGRIEDGDTYGDQLKGNVLACQRRLIDWEKYWKPIREELGKHPDWTIGEAEKELRRRAPAVREAS